ncbi:hypothetical protein HNY73_014561 [Argiope bruennichi]|uniref:Uncharacterized protein n=1 Tax=Argiope bruennichi TaxID=94029 RepID=A0A8T0ETL2_ARGBR|nr:hypothetical protein HNY73_014561 [Argiope bruennichi]
MPGIRTRARLGESQEILKPLDPWEHVNIFFSGNIYEHHSLYLDLKTLRIRVEPNLPANKKRIEAGSHRDLNSDRWIRVQSDNRYTMETPVPLPGSNPGRLGESPEFPKPTDHIGDKRSPVIRRTKVNNVLNLERFKFGVEPRSTL